MRWINDTDIMVELVDAELGHRVVFRQIGWHDQSGQFYDIGATINEPGSFSPVYVQIMPE